MAPSPPLLLHSSHFPSLLSLRPKPHSSLNCPPPGLNFSGNRRTIRASTQQINVAKKKRQPRPSFLDQIRDKWSTKTVSLRDKFPWQEEQHERDDVLAQEQEFRPLISQATVSETEANTISSLRKSHTRNTTFDPRTRIPLAPWIHGGGPRRSPQLETDGAVLSNEFPVVDGSAEINGSDLSFHKLKIIERNDKSEDNNAKKCEMGFDSKGEVVDFDEIGPTEKNETPSIADGDSMRLPRERTSIEESMVGDEARKSKTLVAENLIPETELKRLRNLSLRMVGRIKVGAAGVTQALLDSIHDKWRTDEVVKLKFEGPPAFNMKRTHEILESRTGGLVIWRSGSSLVLYRGMTYNFSCVKSFSKEKQIQIGTSQSSKDILNDATQQTESQQLFNQSSPWGTSYLKDLPKEKLDEFYELDQMLDDLGPRFVDWSGCAPLPVDADLLPPVIAGYKPPFRLLPYGIKLGLRNKETTFLRRTARMMPPHFALGRNRQLQGLAMAMVKLWERSAVAKIAIKRGVPNTCNERMAEELKFLTGGTLLSRNKEYIVFYRGNDFMPPGVTERLEEAQKMTVLRQDEEEEARRYLSPMIGPNGKEPGGGFIAGTLSETIAATTRWGNQPSGEDIDKMRKGLALERQASLVKYLEKKMALAKGKVKMAEKALRKIQGSLEPADLPTDMETITDEERFLFRKIGLSMKPYLLLGRRGVFDGTVENMHLHWKYRELVKIIVQGKSFPLVKHLAISLEAESGGLLVSIDRTLKGYAIIVYRGKNYQRPCHVRPKNLLTRRKALARSIELQRREALKHHIIELEEKIEKLKLELEDVKANGEICEDTDSRVDDAFDDGSMDEASNFNV